MKKRLINFILVVVFVSAVHNFASEHKYPDLPAENEIVQDVSELPKEEITEIPKEVDINNDAMEQYYGIYEITEFWPTLYFYRGHRFDMIREQEADMMLGHIIEIQEDSLVTYECFRWEVVYDGHKTRRENYRIEKVSIDNPLYEWEAMDSASMSMEEVIGHPHYDFPCIEGFEDYREKICGRIRVKVDEYWWQEYYVMEEGIIMYSAITGEYFYLKKLDGKPDKALTAEALSEEEKEKIMQDVYGNYTITEFMPTKFYPALESGGDVLLPQGEADMMIGKKIVVYEQLFTTYDNGRLPNSEAAKRLMEDYFLEKIEITTPDYQIERKLRNDIFGLRDDMLPEEMQQEEYIEINVCPGYGETVLDSVLPQMYLLNDGRLLLYAMGEYFLLEKNEVSNRPFDGMISELSKEKLKEQAVVAYEQFMDGRRYIGDTNIYELSMPTGEPDKRYPTRYAIIDSNGDGIPELNIQTAREFNVYSFENGEITFLGLFMPSLYGYCILKNGAYMCYSDRWSTCSYSYFELDGEGYEINELSFYWDENNGNYIPDEEDDFFFDGEACSMEEWYDRTREYLYTDENGREQIRNQLEWTTYCEADPFETNGQVLYERRMGAYQLTLYDKEHNEVLSEAYTERMWIDGVSEDVLEIGISTASDHTNNRTYYFNKETAQISDSFFNPIVFGDKYIAYMEDDALDAGESTLILSDIFEEGILHQEITRDFSKMEKPMLAVISIEMVDSDNIRLKYYKGEEFHIESEIIGITDNGEENK